MSKQWEIKKYGRPRRADADDRKALPQGLHDFIDALIESSSERLDDESTGDGPSSGKEPVEKAPRATGISSGEGRA